MSTELEALLQRVDIPESTDNTLSSSINKDKDLYTISEGVFNRSRVQDNLEGSSIKAIQVDRDYSPDSTFIGSVKEELSDCRTDHPSSSLFLDLYLILEQTPPPPVVLLVATIQNSAFELEE